MTFVEDFKAFAAQPAHNLVNPSFTCFGFGDQRLVGAENNAFAQEDVLFRREIVDKANRNSKIQSLKFFADSFDQIGFDGKPDCFSLPVKPIV
jgi:hypothetical protein